MENCYLVICSNISQYYWYSVLNELHAAFVSKKIISQM